MRKLPLYNWLNDRAAGVMLHISSLPSDTGIGNLGAGAYRFIDFLNASGISIWQICPLGPTGHGDSPYQCFSVFAGNPFFIDMKPLLIEGLITEEEHSRLTDLPRDHVDYGTLYCEIWPILRLAYDRFKSSKKKQFLDYGIVDEFRKNHGHWLDDYVLFISLKESFGGKCWLEWPTKFRDAQLAKSTELSSSVKNSANAHVFFQYIFYAQLAKLRAYSRSRGVEIMG
ncbi:MAG: 4-alpha-glucanotransferase, partial [Verrucomicrobiota bacterium]|nr:4-alpha-glucanotransferase [Verrucomicrobiota bacterium]